jgi:hypothetical protein
MGAGGKAGSPSAPERGSTGPNATIAGVRRAMAARPNGLIG